MPPFFLMIRRPPRSTLFPTRRSSDLSRPSTSQFRSLGFAMPLRVQRAGVAGALDRKSTRLNSSHSQTSYAAFFFNDTATTEIYTFPYTTLFRSVQAVDVPVQVVGVRHAVAGSARRRGGRG